MQYIVDAKSLKKTFDDFVAVDGISFHVLPGECFGILGPNGAGKTSTIRMIYGFSPLTGGSLEVFGLNISQGWRAIKSRIGVCQQENNLDPDLTVQQNLEVFARYFDIPKDQPGLSEFLNGDAKLDKILMPGPIPKLSVITTGHYPPNPSEFSDLTLLSPNL